MSRYCPEEIKAGIEQFKVDDNYIKKLRQKSYTNCVAFGVAPYLNDLPRALAEADENSAKIINQSIKDIQEKYYDNFKICCICEMAMLYLEEHKKGGSDASS